MVWSAFQGLHRYLLPIGSAGNKKINVVPARLGAVPVLSSLAAADELAEIIETCWHTQPAMVSPEYYCYLFIFAQSLRVSKKYQPTLTPKGWKNLCWYPLKVLRGREGIAKQAWNQFYHQYIAFEHPRPDQASLSKYFPLYPAYAASVEIPIRQQITQLQRLQDEGDSIEDIFKHYNGLGQPSTDGPRWHPLLVWSFPENWVDGGAAWRTFYLEAFTRFLEDGPDIWKLWKEILPIVYRDSDPQESHRWKLVIGQIDRAVKTRWRKSTKVNNAWRRYGKIVRGTRSRPDESLSVS